MTMHTVDGRRSPGKARELALRLHNAGTPYHVIASKLGWDEGSAYGFLKRRLKVKPISNRRIKTIT